MRRWWRDEYGVTVVGASVLGLVGSVVLAGIALLVGMPRPESVLEWWVFLSGLVGVAALLMVCLAVFMSAVSVTRSLRQKGRDGR